MTERHKKANAVRLYELERHMALFYPGALQFCQLIPADLPASAALRLLERVAPLADYTSACASMALEHHLYCCCGANSPTLERVRAILPDVRRYARGRVLEAG